VLWLKEKGGATPLGPWYFFLFRFFSFTLYLFVTSFLFSPDIGKEVGRERWVGHKVVGVRKGDHHL
jgi:hypothetical protein